jgi:N6-L-threonylcarbamoyladenine synthase
VFDYVGRALIEMSEAYTEKFGTGRFLFAGGVMSNSIIKKMISERVDALFAEPRLSADNAVGIAVLALKKYKKENP